MYFSRTQNGEDHWFHLMRTEHKVRAVKVVELADAMLSLSEMTTGPSNVPHSIPSSFSILAIPESYTMGDGSLNAAGFKLPRSLLRASMSGSWRAILGSTCLPTEYSATP